ncbi:hypothetical protein ACIFOC_01176 [Leucobacter aridicollis]|uniref:signal peptidase I n=1 Tax=Leucobacter aridicollis TaxID=283878 RepID=UPI0037C63305
MSTKTTSKARRQPVRTKTRTTARKTTRGWYDSPWQIAARAIGSAFAIVVIAALAALLVVPRVLGGDSLTVLSGSMEPTFSPGDVVVVKGTDEAKVCTDVSVGQIVTYFPEPNDPTLITHRVIGKTIGTFEDGTSCRLITQGDANSSVDEPVSPAQVRGVFMYGVPGLGWIRQWVSQNPMIVAGIAAAVLIGWGALSSFRKPRTTVVSVPRPQGAGPSGTGAAVPAPTVTYQAPAAEPREQDLRERELAIREREIELRERELAFAMGGRDAVTEAEALLKSAETDEIASDTKHSDSTPNHRNEG